MASYKVLQDIEAEDKLVGPLSLRQFIYAGIAAIALFIAFKLAFVNIFLVTPFIPVIVLFGLLAVPFGHDQPSEVWLLAKIKFFVKPHRRIWNKDGNVNLVTITAPKVTQKNLTKNFSQGEARSRLQALANTIDSRGWSVKNVNINLSAPTTQIVAPEDSDRLIDPKTLPQSVPQADVAASDDIMDTANNAVAQHLDEMVTNSRQSQKERAVASLSPQPADDYSNSDQPAVKPDYWFMNNQTDAPPLRAGYEKFGDDKVIRPHEDDPAILSAEAPDDEELAKKIETSRHKTDIVNSHLHVLQPLSKRTNKPNIVPPKGKVTPQSNPDIMKLALANRANWSVATQARQAEKAKRSEPPQDEVVVSLH